MGAFIDAFVGASEFLAARSKWAQSVTPRLRAFFRALPEEAERRLEAGRHAPYSCVKAACRVAGVPCDMGAQWVHDFLLWRNRSFRLAEGGPDGMTGAVVTEREWGGCADPQPMLAIVQKVGSNRKARLFACGLGRALWRYLVDGRSRRVVEVAERYADDLATDHELLASEHAASLAARGAASRTVCCLAVRNAGSPGTELEFAL